LVQGGGGFLQPEGKRKPTTHIDVLSYLLHGPILLHKGTRSARYKSFRKDIKNATEDKMGISRQDWLTRALSEEDLELRLKGTFNPN